MSISLITSTFEFRVKKCFCGQDAYVIVNSVYPSDDEGYVDCEVTFLCMEHCNPDMVKN